MAAAAVAVGARLVHVSSDTVFGGTGAPYADDASPDPVNLYGQTKAHGERWVSDVDPAAAIVRTSLIYGTTQMDRGTASFADRLASGQPLQLFADVLRQPVWADALATGLLTLALDRPDVAGTLNLAGGEVLTARRVRHGHAGVLAPGHTAGVELVNATGRTGVPLDLRLRHDRARSLGLATPGVTEVLAGLY